MRLQELTTTRLAMGVALWVARCRPPKLGHALARFIADRIAARKSSDLLRGIRANQWIVRGRPATRRELDDAAQTMLRNAARSLYDFYHNLHVPELDTRLVCFDAKVSALLDRMRAAEEGVVVVAPHLSNFDLVVRAAVQTGVQTQILTLNHGAPAYQLQDLLRRNPNLTVTPVGLHSLKMAVRRLRDGGSVVTGIDRPVPESHYRLRFFDRPTALPVHHIHLALMARVPVSVISVRREADGQYHVSASDLVAMSRHTHRTDEIVRNAEHILDIAAGLIRRNPDQWSMFYPVWPEAIAEMERAGL